MSGNPDLTADIRSHLMKQNEIFDLVGSRVFTDVLDPEAELPAIVIQFIDQIPHRTLDTNASTSATSRITLEFFGNKPSTARKVADVTRTTNFESYRGEMGNTWVDECSCEQSLRTREEKGNDKSQNHRHVAEQDYLILHQL